MGEKNVIDLPIRMTAEDFSYFANAVPSCFYRLGTGNKDKVHGFTLSLTLMKLFENRYTFDGFLAIS